MKINEIPSNIVSKLGAVLPKWKPGETEKLIHQLDKASSVMYEVELLLEEISKCESKLEELETLRKAPPKKRTRIPLVGRLFQPSEEALKAELTDQITAYRSMLAGLNGHLLQIVLHQCKEFQFLGSYLYPVAVSELKQLISTGAAETLPDAIQLYEDSLARRRGDPAGQAFLRKQEDQAKRMAKVLKEAHTM
jgi:hypothetical protein